MGKRIISQRRGRGTNTYKVSKRAFRFKLKYPKKLSGEGTVTKLFDSAAHSAPLAKVSSDSGSFYMPAFKNMLEKQKISFDTLKGTPKEGARTSNEASKKIENGNIVKLREIPVKTHIYNIESLSLKEVGDLITNVQILEEIPLTHKDNKLIIWK